jgi:WD40 repeat protein
VVAFDLDNDGVTAVAFYQNDEGDADEAAILHYDLTTEREIATLRPTADNCRFTSASLSNFPDDSGTVALVIGQRCTGEAQMRWQLYTVDAAGSAALVANDPLSGDFVAFARNNNLFFSPDGATLYFTTPDGVAPHTVAIAAVAITADRAITVPVERQAAFQTFNARDNAIPAFSPDARWLAFMLTSPNSDNFLYALDIADPNNPPIMISAGARGDVVNALAFTPDSARLIYTAGGADEGSDNSVFALDLTTGTEARVRRGTFGGALIIAPDGVRAALNEWVLADNNGDPLLYRAVRLVDLTTNLESTLFEPPFDGANTFSADPIAWRTAF